MSRRTATGETSEKDFLGLHSTKTICSKCYFTLKFDAVALSGKKLIWISRLNWLPLKPKNEEVSSYAVHSTLL